jgi:hypothetical protein
MKLLALAVALSLVLGVTGRARAQPAPDGWQGIVLVVATSEINAGRLLQALAAFAPAFGQQPNEVLHVRLSLDKTKALVEANWFVQPIPADLLTALASIDPLMVVTIFGNSYEAKTYLQNNINDWEISRPR